MLLAEIKHALSLSIPLIAALLAQMGIEVVDTLMIGRMGPQALAASALGTSSFMILIIISVGMLSGVGILISKSQGEHNKVQSTLHLHQGIYLSLILAVPSIILIRFLPDLLLLLGQKEMVIALTKQYLHALSFGLPAVFLFISLRGYVAALKHAHIIMILMIFAIPCNAGLNYILMYGYFGLPKLGIAGVGYASSIAEWSMVIALIIYIQMKMELRDIAQFTDFYKPCAKVLWQMTWLGFPIGVTMALEVGLFSFSAMMMGYVSIDALAAHQIALQSATIAFMFPYGISQASSLLVSHAHGANDIAKLKRMIFICLGFGAISSTIAALLFIFLPETIISLFLGEGQARHLIPLASSFLILAALFQCLDAVQSIMNGALRGMQDTIYPMLIGFVSYWGVGLGSAYILAFYFNWKGQGIWLGLALGIIAAGILLSIRAYQLLKTASSSSS